MTVLNLLYPIDEKDSYKKVKNNNVTHLDLFSH